MLPGLGATAAEWEAVTTALGVTRTVVWYELPGHGNRNALPEPASIGALAADLATRLIATAAAPVTLIGHSLGGVIALSAAIAYPERCRALVLIGTTPEAAPPEEREQMRRLAGHLLGAGDSSRAAVARAYAERPDQTGLLEGLTVPALIVAGELDGWHAQRGAELLHGWMPNSRLVRIAGAGHHPHREQPGALLAAMLAFLQEVDGQSIDSTAL